MPANQRFLDTQRIAEYLGVHEKQVYTLIHERGLPATRVTGKWLFPKHLVDRWLEASVVNMPEMHSFLQAVPEVLLIAGSDDLLLVRFIGLYRNRHPNSLVLQSRTGSSDGLMALKRGLVHIACVHLVDSGGGYTNEHTKELLGEEIAVVHFAEREQGIILAPGNPLSIEDPGHAWTRDLRWAVREVGTGTRALMEMEMDRAGVAPDPLLARAVPVQNHLDAANAIRSGDADAGFGILAAAHLTGCFFLPLRRERFDLIVRKENFFFPQIQEFMAMLQEEDFRKLAAGLKGYDLGETGKLGVG